MSSRLSTVKGKPSSVEGCSAGTVPGRDGTGYLTYVAGGRLLAVPFDADSLQLRGAAFPLLDEVFDHRSLGFARFHFSRSGSLVYRTPLLSTVEWLGADGSSRPLLSQPGAYSATTLSPDGAHPGRPTAWLSPAPASAAFDWRRSMSERVDSEASAAVWTPDGQYLVLGNPDGMS